MMLLLTLTGLAGFVASGLLRRAGVGAMGLRYPVCVGIAYLVFLLLLALWLGNHRRRRRWAESFAGPSPAVCDPFYYDPWPGPIVPGSGGSQRASTSGGGVKLGGGKGGGLDGDGLAVVLVVILILIALGAALVASVWVIVEAPALLAEVLVDGLLMAGVARRLRRQPPAHWAWAVLARTFWVALILAACFSAVGFALTWLEPEATSMAEAFRMADARRL
jgi:hypothetical protein